VRTAIWCTGLFLVGCSARSCSAPSAADNAAPDAAPVAIPSAAPSIDAAVAHALATKARKIEAGTHADACEAHVGAQRRKVAEAVDAMWSNIEARGAALAEAPPYTRVRLGPTYVRARAVTAAPPRGWTSRDRSWEAQEKALAALGPAVDEGWVALARETRALLVFDTVRIVAGAWHDTSHAALPPQNVEPNAGVKREGNQLTVPLDAGPFDKNKDDLTGFIETAWTSPALKVKVRWTSQETEPLAYKFDLEDVAGEPSYVSEKWRAIVLNPDVRAHAVAHELGHVLGFADRYAKRWDAARCVYVDEREPGDIMSEPDGPVTTDEWSLLAATYPKP
jgi:hypothetical protein